MAKPDEVKIRRDKDQVLTAIRAKRFSGNDTLQMGLNLSNLVLKVAGEK
ncbi:MAG: hypothetical protein ACW99U_14950 [Candidatus Thorarchaeota archaeon]|jgi:hypothetical protein